MKATCLALIVLCFSASAHAATRTAASCSRADVGTAVNSASDGDTVVIPAGTCTWTSNLTITGKILVLQGSGMDQTVIVDGVSKEMYPNIPQVLVYYTKPGGLTRITGMTFQGGTIADVYNKGMVHIRGNSDQFRMDHVKISHTETNGVSFYDNVRGVLDHSTIRFPSVLKVAIYLFHDSWNNIGEFGDASYADDPYWGTNKAIFLEDNVFEADAQGVAVDGWSGSRVVFRNNMLRNVTFTNHGTETGGRWRSQRTFEVYNNTFTYDKFQWSNMVGIRGGTGVVFNNTGTYTGGGYTNEVVELTNYRFSDRSRAYVPFGFCDGSNIWDGNQDNSGYPCLDQPGRGRGDLISGYEPAPAAWTRQVLDPIYGWNNSLNGQLSNLKSNTSVIVEGRDFFNAVKPNYTPYAYPHPLTQGGTNTSPPKAPTNLRIGGE